MLYKMGDNRKISAATSQYKVILIFRANYHLAHCISIIFKYYGSSHCQKYNSGAVNALYPITDIKIHFSFIKLFDVLHLKNLESNSFFSFLVHLVES